MGLREPEICIVGAGMSGLLMGIRLKQAGIESFRIHEKASSLGGTWRENTYPGIACDVPSHLYSYSFEPNPDWSHRFSPGSEIQAYFENVSKKYDLEKYVNKHVVVKGEILPRKGLLENTFLEVKRLKVLSQ